MRTRRLLLTFGVTLGLLGLVAGTGGTTPPRPRYQPLSAAPPDPLPRPPSFPAPVTMLRPVANEPAAFELGRALFYDQILSGDGTVSCGSCHQQAKAFSDGRARAVGVGGQRGLRNAPALQNLRWRRGFMADGGARGLELQALAPLSSPVEMHLPLADALARLNADAGYRRRFATVFGPGTIDTPQLLRALAAFTAALTSARSPYDRWARHEPGAQFSPAALRGRAVFAGQCAGCHAGELFTDESFRNNGLDRRWPTDSGRARISLRPADAGRFKVPSLRNVARTAPYMHDGRFPTLPAVLAHYAHGVRPSPTLDPLLRPSGRQLGLALSTKQQADLLAFLHTLTDEAFLRDPRLGPPRHTPGGTFVRPHVVAVR